MANNETRTLAARLIFAVVKILKENGSEMPGKQVIEEVEKKVPMGEWEKHRYEKTGYIRWRSILQFYIIDLIKAGFLIKKKGIWFLTPEGESAIKLGETALLDAATKAYREWRQKNPKQSEPPEPEIAATEESAKQDEISADEIEQSAYDQIESFINRKTPFEFQDLAAALLRGMCYELFWHRTFHQTGLARFFGLCLGWRRNLRPNNRAAIVWAGQVERLAALPS